MANLDAKKQVEEFAENLVKKIGLKAEIEVEEKDADLKVLVNGEELGALIGYHGETLESLQLLLSLMLNRKLASGEWQNVIVDIGNWREGRLEVLRSMVAKAADELKAGKDRAVLPAMSSGQRREAHVIISEDYPELLSESEGQEPNRAIVLKIK